MRVWITYAIGLCALVWPVLGNADQISNPNHIPCSATLEMDLKGSWKQQAAVAECLRERHNYAASEQFYLNALLAVGDQLSAADTLARGWLRYHYALNSISLHRPKSDFAMDILFAYEDNPDRRIERLVRQYAPTHLPELIERRRLATEKAHADALARESERALDAGASQDARDQFEWWDHLTPDQRDVVEREGGTRRNNTDQHPCHVSTVSAAGYYAEDWTYCVDDKPYVMYHFLNGKLDMTVRL